MSMREMGKMGTRTDSNSHRRRASWVLGMIWLGLVGLAVAGRQGESWWWFDLAAHFRVQYLWGALLLCMAALLARCWVCAGASLGLAATLVTTLVPFWFGTSVTPTGSERLRILSANVLSGNSRTDLFREVLLEQSPDVLVLMEFSPEWAEALKWLDVEYPHRCLEPRRGNFGMAIYSRRPLTRQRVLNLGEQGPLCMAVDLELAGRPLTVWGVHTYPPVSAEASAARNMHLANLARLMGEEPADCVVVGDLNCTSWSPWFEIFTQQTGLRDSRTGWGVQATWPARPLWLAPLQVPIDHCLVSSSVGVAARHVTGRFGSDHVGVVVDLGWAEVVERGASAVQEKNGGT